MRKMRREVTGKVWVVRMSHSVGVLSRIQFAGGGPMTALEISPHPLGLEGV
jgi:hypothetical protein